MNSGTTQGICIKTSSQLATLHLIIPKLLRPLKVWQKDFLFSPESPQLSALLSHFKTLPSHQSTGIDASLFASIGWLDNNELPIAYYRYKAFLKTCKNGGGGYLDDLNKNGKTLLCADPVHLEVGLNDITLTQVMSDLSENETQQCINALNQHFKQDGFEFLDASKQQWCLLINTEAHLKTTPLTEVIRKNAAHFTTKSDGLNWGAIQNEIQMILHALPLNQAREEKGLVTINSLWLYGAGKPEANGKTEISASYGGIENRGKMIAEAANCESFNLPDNASDLLKATGKTLIILDQLLYPAINEDLENFQRQLTQLDHYLQPLIKAWQDGKINLIIDDCSGNLIQPLKNSRWKFWAKKSQSLTEIHVNNL